MNLRGAWLNFLAAVQFLTRIPVPASASSADSLPRAALYFPVVGSLLGTLAAAVHTLLAPHLPRLLAASITVAFTVLLTGALHEDALADAADGFGGGWTRERILAIMRDSRIGSYGAIALVFSLTIRIALIASLPLDHVAVYLIVAHTLCRCTALPLTSWLPPARTEEAAGLGAGLARRTTPSTLVFATLYTIAIVALLLRLRAIAPLLAATVLTVLSGIYYRRSIQGITGDCLGATIQLTEMATYLCGAWIA